LLYVTIAHNAGNPNEARIRRSESEYEQLVRDISQEIGYNSSPEIVFYDEGPTGQCNSVKLFNMHISNLGFNRDVLNGGYTEEEINQIIRHELAHAIANERYNDECSHDDRWKEVCNEIKCDSSETLGLCKAYFEVTLLDNKKRKYKYYLLCEKCQKVQLRTDNCGGVIPLLVMSAANVSLPLTFGNLGLKSNCCDSKYRLQASAEGLLADLEERKELSNIQKRLRQLLDKQ